VSEVTVASLDPRQQQLAENARLALERGQLDYVLEVTAVILHSNPGCLPLRRLQRAAQLRRCPAWRRWLARLLNPVAAWLTGAGMVHPARAFATAEQRLARNPCNVPALQLLARAAAALDLPATAAFAFEAVRELEPGNRSNLLALGEAWLAAGQPAEALRLADHLLAERPGEAGALALQRKASVVQTVKQGNWESPGTFREKLKDEASRPPFVRGPGPAPLS